jgi:hypothetical protein
MLRAVQLPTVHLCDVTRTVNSDYLEKLHKWVFVMEAVRQIGSECLKIVQMYFTLHTQVITVQ